MIDRDSIEVGDKVFTRDGGCLVAWKHNGQIFLGLEMAHFWTKDGRCGALGHLDIIRIDKAPKPVELLFCMSGGAFNTYFGTNEMEDKLYMYDHIIKLTIINGKLEKSEQVK